MSNFGPFARLPDPSELTWIQGSPSDLTHDHKLMLIIQPNCPGCHIHAIPLANALFQSKHDFDIYCVSTVFEDFDLNTEETARLLLSGKHVGDARAKLGEVVKNVPCMPFAHDIVVPKTEASIELKNMALEASKSNARDQLQGHMSSGILELQLSRAGFDILPDKIARVFYTVRAMGTPTWVLHTAEGQVLAREFGQFNDEEELLKWIRCTTTTS